MPKWAKMLLGVVLSVVIFGGVVMMAFDMHPLGGSSEAWANERECRERIQYSDSPESVCYEAFRRESEAVEWNERLISAGIGAVAVGLFWFLVNLLYLRPRRLRREQEENAA